jgi:hypothetical protein
MRVWLDKDSFSPFYSMADAEEETAEYCRNAKESDLLTLGLTAEDFTEYQKFMEQFWMWQEKLERMYAKI